MPMTPDRRVAIVLVQDESEVDKKDLARAVTGAYHEIVEFNIEMNVMVIMQRLENRELKMRCK